MTLFCTPAPHGARILSPSWIGKAIALCCLGTTLILRQPVPVAADLLYRSDSLHAPVWKRIYEKLSPVWKAERPVRVREVTDAEMDRIVAETEGESAERDDSVVDGCYTDRDPEESGPSQITLRASLRGDAAEMVFTHEYGHYVWSEVLSSAERARYRRIWREQRRAHHLVTAYASEDCDEGFAEAFAYYQRRPETLRRKDSLSWDFLTEIKADRDNREDRQP